MSAIDPNLFQEHFTDALHSHFSILFSFGTGGVRIKARRACACPCIVAVAPVLGVGPHR